MNEKWFLWDYRPPSDEVDFAPKHVIESAGELERLLNDYRHDDPGVYLLCNPNGPRLRIGITDEFGFVVWVDSVVVKIVYGEPPEPESPETLFFRFEGQYEEIFPSQLIRFQKVVDIVLHYFRTEQLLGVVKWRTL